MSGSLKIAAAQINTRVNDIRANVEAIKAAWAKARAEGAELLVTPELSITGYPLEDSVEQPDILEAARKGLDELRALTAQGEPALVVGLPQKMDGGKIYNTAVLLHQGQVQGMVRKMNLPNYDVFDERRNYAAGEFTAPLVFKGHKLGIMICEDTWFTNVARSLDDQGAEVLISINASPAEIGKPEKRLTQVLQKRVDETNLPILYVNQVGGQDEVVFDGYSMAVNADGKLQYRAKGFTETLDIVTLKTPDKGRASFVKAAIEPLPQDRLEYIYRTLVNGTRDYFAKKGFRKAILGMSGGIDSAVVAAIAVDALGPENVRLYRLPSRYTEDISNTAADDAAKMLGAAIDGIAIEPAFIALQDMLKDRFAEAAKNGQGKAVALALENMQARIRGTVLMSLSNAGEGLLLTTGNKSEVSVGYCTLYGDMNGGFNPLKDVYKMQVYALADWRNKHLPPDMKGPRGMVVPQVIIDRAPSAELAAGQKDQDSLPPYPVLDAILERYIEEQKSMIAIVHETGQPAALVQDVITKVDNAEFKRRQSAPGVKISARSYGKGRRYPIAQPPLPAVVRGMEP